MADIQNTVSTPASGSNNTQSADVQGKKQEIHDCYYFLTTGCSKGDQCKYRHKEDIKQVNMLCQRFLHGGCFNPDCKFIHLTVLPSLANQKPHPKPKIQKECVFFKKGTCKNGDKCPYLHVKNNDVNAELLNKFESLLQQFTNNMPEKKQTKRNFQQNESTKRLRVYGEEGDPLGFGRPLDDFATRAARARKFSTQSIQLHTKQKNVDSNMDFVVRTRKELLEQIEAKKAEEAKKVEEAKIQNSVVSTEETSPRNDVDEEDDEDLEEMNRLLGGN